MQPSIGHSGVIWYELGTEIELAVFTAIGTGYRVGEDKYQPQLLLDISPDNRRAFTSTIVTA